MSSCEKDCGLTLEMLQLHVAGWLCIPSSKQLPVCMHNEWHGSLYPNFSYTSLPLHVPHNNSLGPKDLYLSCFVPPHSKIGVKSILLGAVWVVAVSSWHVSTCACQHPGLFTLFSQWPVDICICTCVPRPHGVRLQTFAD